MTIKKSAVRLNSDAHRPARDMFVELINGTCRREGWRPFEALAVFLEAGYRATRRPTLRGKAAIEKNEAAYAAIVKRCHRDPGATMTDMARLLATTAIALEAAPIDFLGPVFEELAASQWMGQFFTPYSLSKMMAAMILPTDLPDDRVIWCQEPACGVGGMVLAACEVFRERGIDITRRVHWQMVDVDSRAIAGAYIQTTLCGISAEVIHGNTLSLETWEVSDTFAAIMHPKRRDTNPEEIVVIRSAPQGELFA